MIKKEIFIGFLTGIIANMTGIMLYILLFSDLGVIDTIREAIKGDFMGAVITAGAILNFLPFFVFLKKAEPYRARGVLMATILAALVIAALKFL